MQMTLNPDPINAGNYRERDGGTNNGLTCMALAAVQDILVPWTFTDVFASGSTASIELQDIDLLNFGLQNPCGIGVAATLPNMTRLVTDSATYAEDFSASVTETCPALTT